MLAEFGIKARHVVLIVVLVLGLILITSSCTVISSGSVGVVYRMGAIQEEAYEAGLHFKAPFIEKVQKTNVQTRKVEVAAAAASKDMQSISTIVAVNYRVDAQSAAKLLRNVGAGFEQVVVSPAIQEAVKATVAQYSAEQLITRRQEVGTAMVDELSAKIAPYGLVVEGINIVNFDFSDEFNAAIEAKQTAQQNALRAEQELARITIEAQQKVAQAKAEAEAAMTLADAEAYSISVVQEQIAQNEAYLEYKKIEQWDGVLPKVQGAAASIVDIGEVG